MKSVLKIKYAVLVCILVLVSPMVYAQLNPVGIAPGLNLKSSQFTTHDYKLGVNTSELLREDSETTFEGGPLRTAISVPVNKDFFSMGEWVDLPDGGRFYRVQISSTNAKGLMVAFDAFHLPEFARLFFYNPEKDYVVGGYTYEDNPPGARFPGPVIPSSTVIMEYHEPWPEKIVEKPLLKILDIAHFYRGVNDGLKNAQIGAAGPCHVNINCPEGDEWQQQKRGVVRILIRSGTIYSWCSGSLVNNTAQDGTPYILTADHCGGGVLGADLELWQFRFNFERPECANQGLPVNQSIAGCSRIAQGPVSGGSDFQLLRLNFTPPPSFNPHYNGWDRRVVAPVEGVAIHHPRGDLKKISTFNDEPVTVNDLVISGFHLAYRSMWNVRFVATQSGHGGTEGGSSGSPLFNHEGLLIGTLTGGNANCGNPEGNNFVGKFHHHWETNGSSPELQLKPWLDPVGTGQMTLPGIDLYPAPSVRNLNATVNDDFSVTLNWEFPGFFQQPGNWFSNISNYTNVVFDTPQRAVLFDINQQISADTFYLTKLAHFFWEHPTYLWGNDNLFKFRVYDYASSTMLFESPVLPALNLQNTNLPVIFELVNALPITGPFYVSIVPGNSGHPSSLAMKVASTSHSFFGEPGSWQPLVRDGDEFEMLVSVFGLTQNPDTFSNDKNNGFEEGSGLEQTYELMRFGADPLVFQRMATADKNQKNFTTTLMENVKFYKIYRDGVQIYQTPNAQVFSFTDTSDLVENQIYHYHLTAIYDTNPNNPFSPDHESVPSETVEVKITQNNTGTNYPITSVREPLFQVYPNPSTGKIFVRINDTAVNGVFEIVDMNGSVLKTTPFHSQDVISIDLSNFARGVYFVRLISSNISSVERIILQ